jgi:hypothetical protein
MKVQATTRGTKLVINKLESMAELSTFLGATRGKVGTNVSYAGFVNDGTKPHLITPRNAQALFWPTAPHPVNEVHHPGYRGSHFIQAAQTEARDEVVTALWVGFEARNNDTRTESRLVLLAALDALLRKAREKVNVKTGNLRDSLHTEVI